MKIENVCCCSNATAPCPFWVAQNWHDREDNFKWLAQANDQLLHGDMFGCLMSQQAWFRVEALRCGRMVQEMQIHKVEAVTYAECCNWLDGYEQLLLDRYIRLVEDHKQSSDLSAGVS